MYAIVETGGKQYRVVPGQTLPVDRLSVAEGESLELDRVLLIDDGKSVTVGKPVIDGARVTATAGISAKGRKVIVFKYKPKTRYQRKKGHRQYYTPITIGQIIGPDGSEVVPAE